MEIERITGKLLTQHNCVIIPGFGGFIANPSGATIHPGRHTFSPPYKAILFNRSLTANDGLLANALLHENGISYADAMTAIEQFARTAEQALRQRNKVIFAELGFLQADFEGNINFTQDYSVNYLYDSFGLDEFQSLPIETKATIQRRVQPKVDRVVVHPAVASKRRRSPRAIAALVTVAVLVGIASLLVGIGVNNGNNMAGFIDMFTSSKPASGTKWITYTAKPIIREAIIVVDTTVSAPAVADVAPTAMVNTVKEEAAPSSKILVPVIESANIHIIAASYEEKDRADKYASKLKNQGFDTYIIDKKSDEDMYKVGIASFYSLSSAKEYIGLLQAPLNAKVWIYTDK